MTGILRRIILILKAWLNAFLSSAEDPRQVFAVAHQRQQALLAKVREAQANVATSKERLEAKTAQARDKLPKLEKQARQALMAGREDLARFALQLRLAAVNDLQVLEQQVQELEQEERTLSLAEQRLATQIEAFHARQEVIAARYTTAEAHVRLHEALGGVSEELADVGQALERAEQRTEGMQARASAIERLVELGVLEAPEGVVGQAAMPHPAGDDASQAIEEHLTDLKREVGLGDDG